MDNNHTEFQDPTLGNTNIIPTSEVHTASMLVLMIPGNYKIRRSGSN